ncbi:adenylate kinase 8 isoform X2 [Pseudoliparis swirei]|uniref:adenylate kinase 8 isoform X2 n=1 Tax=Pseudoliparis swirei TaxID=2059687 RepID=UPI0024BE8BD9|nr:adenylate kinase 8 isoform X2 [Pseudoliparis swirei]
MTPRSPRGWGRFSSLLLMKDMIRSLGVGIQTCDVFKVHREKQHLLMDETVKPLRVPPHMAEYADKHDVFHLLQSMLSSLLVDQPDDPIGHLTRLLQRTNVDIPRVLVLGPPAVGKHTVATKLSAELRAIHVTTESLLQDQSEHSIQELPTDQLVGQIQQRLNEIDCFNRGWVLEGFPQTRLQALSLQQAGVIPEHVVLLQAPDDVLSQRDQGKLVDPLTGDAYHETFVLPPHRSVARRLEAPSPPEGQREAELQRHRSEVTGLSSAYQHVLKVVNADQPHADVYQQVLAFVRTRRRCRTPRILLLGPPGSGKSHQAGLLAHKYKMVDVSCGRLLRSVAADGSALGEEIQSYLDGGRPVPDSLVLQVLEERLSRLDCSHRGWILHGFPRDLQQAKSLQESHPPNSVFFLECTSEVCVERLTLRATDPVSGEKFHAVTRPAPSSEVQNRLKTRPEDHTHSVTHTLNQHRVHTAGLQGVSMLIRILTLCLSLWRAN